MMTLARIVTLSLLLILAFTLITYVLPQMKEEAPQNEELDLGSLTMDTFVRMGEELYGGRGQCTLCHNSLGRAPDLLALNAQQTAMERLADPAYQGHATEAKDYLHESMLDPNVYVVKGFGKKGTNDSESPMTAVDKPPIQLAPTEIDAIVAFLQAKDGNPVTVALPSQSPAQPEAEAQMAIAQTPAAPAMDHEAALAKFGCLACHSLLGLESPIGPDLNDVGARLNTVEIRESIVNPNAVVAEGYVPMMPDLSATMTVKELELIVQFLVTQRG